MFVAIANAATTTGPLYVWRNVAQNQAGMFSPEGGRGQRGPFVKAGSRKPEFNGGRAYYFHNTAQSAGKGIAPSGGKLYNFVSLNNVFGRKERDERVERIPNFNDRYAQPAAGASQDGAPPMRFGAEAQTSARSAH